MMMGEPDEHFLIASSAGYGFVCKLEDMLTRNRAGKTVLSVPKGAKALAPVKVRDLGQDWIVAVGSQGHMLVIPVRELPILSRGKGNKIINIPGRKVASGDEAMCVVALVQDKESITLHSGKRIKKMSAREVKTYAGERAQRGSRLSRGYRSVDAIAVHCTKPRGVLKVSEG